MADEMIYEACVEVRPDGAALAQLCDMPAAVAPGSDEPDALAALEESLPAYFAWLSRHDEYTPVMQGRARVVVAEALRLVDPTVGVFFQSDARPISTEDLDWYTALLEWSYEDLAAALARVPPTAWDAPFAGLQTPRAFAVNVAGRQFWLLSRFGMVAPTDPPPSPADALHTTVSRAGMLALSRLRAAPQEAYDQVLDRDGERWSLRKLLRRSILLVRASTAELEGAAI